MTDSLYVREQTTATLAALYEAGKVVVLLAVGSVEPHGPHLPLGTDTTLAEESALRGARLLRERGLLALIAPTIPYGVTDYAAGFKGAISIPPNVLTALLVSVAEAYLHDGATHVCYINHHLEPAHDAALRAAHVQFPPGKVSVACPLKARWARLLSDEFKAGECHAGEYETALMLAAGAEVDASYTQLADVPVSLSKAIKAGKHTFREMGLVNAYAGHPRTATRDEGERLYALHAEMIRAEVMEALELNGL